MKIEFGNFWKKAFWSWETRWKQLDGTYSSVCNIDTIYEIKSYYFWFFKLEFKKLID